jgi:hypothetical protein
MSIRWILMAVAGLLVTGCGASGDSPEGCKAGDTSKNVCLMCGLAGGCAQSETRCARICSSSADCADLQLGCWDGVCQIGGCR